MAQNSPMMGNRYGLFQQPAMEMLSLLELLTASAGVSTCCLVQRLLFWIFNGWPRASLSDPADVWLSMVAVFCYVSTALSCHQQCLMLRGVAITSQVVDDTLLEHCVVSWEIHEDETSLEQARGGSLR
jgi:hypothetical protein